MWLRMALNSINPGWPQTQGDTSASASQTLGLQAGTTMSGIAEFLINLMTRRNP